MKLSEYLGKHVSHLLQAQPFAAWPHTRTVESDLPRTEIWYEFTDRDVEVICSEDETIRTIFLHEGVDHALSDIPFSTTRREVIARLGEPSASGRATRHPVLGSSGAWDRFRTEGGAIHVQYKVDLDAVELITLVRADAIPR